MYPDYFYNFLNIGVPWIWIAIGYASFDYIYNLFMCSLLGGITQIRKYYKIKKNRTKTIFKKADFVEIQRSYKIGSQKLLKEFRTDKLSWLWPITSLAIPTLIYGISRGLTTNGISSLSKSGVNFQDYFLLPNNVLVQSFFWGAALILSLRTFYRYHKERSKPTWFSRVWIFGFSRALLFDLPLAYMVMNIVYIWFQYSISLFQVLSSNEFQYTILHPDLMYGLGQVYNTVVVMGVFLIILSFLPALMLIREKEQRYNKMYYFLVYGGIITLFLLLSFLVIKFDQRLGNIQEIALNDVQNKIKADLSPDIETIANLEYFFMISNLPRGFPIPTWVSFLLSARAAVLFFELVRIISPSTYKSNATRILQIFLEK